jgi:hypothetical protein
LDNNVNRKTLVGDIKILFEDGDELLEQINLEIGGVFILFFERKLYQMFFFIIVFRTQTEKRAIKPV